MNAVRKGIITQIIGPVVDIHFSAADKEQTELPAIHEAIVVNRPEHGALVLEVQQHIGEYTVRTIAMESTDGLRRGMEALTTQSPIDPMANPISN